MGIRCGIDLGTTYSSIAWYDPDNRRVEIVSLEHANGQRAIPSVVYFEPEGHVAVGEVARNAAWQYPDRVINGIKRVIMDDDYKTTPIDGKEYTPQEVVAEILKVLKADAESDLNNLVTDVVIAVPPYFEEKERLVIQEAAKVARLNVLELILEPHAAALAFAIDRIKEVENCNILVYDLGGATFDLTLIETEREELVTGMPSLRITLLDKISDQQLGGLDWDSTLARLVADKTMNEYDLQDPLLDPKSKASLLEWCEVAKRQLCRGHSYFLTGLYGHRVEVSYREFESATSKLVSQTEELLEQILVEAEQNHGLLTEKRIQKLVESKGMSRVQLESKKVQLLLCGGGTRMPAMQKRVTDIMGEPLLCHKNPELLVTMGAAYRAHLIGPKDDELNKAIVIVDYKQPSVAHVIDIFRSLNLPVTDDSQQIDAKRKEFYDFYLRMSNSPEPQQRYRAQNWFQNLTRLQKERSALLDIVYKYFTLLADIALDAALSSGTETLTQTAYDKLKQLSLEECKCDPLLADRFLNNYLRQRGIAIDNRIVLPPPPHYDPVCIQAFIEDYVPLSKFCFVLQHKLRSGYAYLTLAGANPAEKSIELVQLAKRNEELGKVVFYLVQHWIQRDNSCRVLIENGLDKQLDIFRRECLRLDDRVMADQVLELQAKILSESNLVMNELAPSSLFEPIVNRIERLEQVVSQLVDTVAVLRDQFVMSERLHQRTLQLTADIKLLVEAVDLTKERPLQHISERLESFGQVITKLADVEQLFGQAVFLPHQIGGLASGDDDSSFHNLVERLLTFNDKVKKMRQVAESESKSDRNYQTLQGQILESLQAVGVYPVSETLRFDPAIHEIVGTIDCQTPDEDGEIVATRYNDFRTEGVLHAAEVIVKRYQPSDHVMED